MAIRAIFPLNRLDLKLLCVSEPVTSKPQSIHITDFFRALFQQDTISDGIVLACPTATTRLANTHSSCPPRHLYSLTSANRVTSSLGVGVGMLWASRGGFREGYSVPVLVHLPAVV